MRLMGLSDDSSDHDDSSNQGTRRRGKSSLELAKKCPSCVDGRAYGSGITRIWKTGAVFTRIYSVNTIQVYLQQPTTKSVGHHKTHVTDVTANTTRVTDITANASSGRPTS